MKGIVVRKIFVKKNIVTLLLALCLSACGGGNTSAAQGSSYTSSSLNNLSVQNSDNNPFVGASFYVDPNYVSQVESFFIANPDYRSLPQTQQFLDSNNKWNVATSVWLDRIAAIDGYDGILGVKDHLANALSQSNSIDKPVTISFVVYDLPNRDCDAFSSNGEIIIPSNGNGDEQLQQYQADYIDQIYTKISQFYANNPTASDKVRVVLVIEPDSLPNMITNANSTASCSKVAQNHIYQRGVAYALSKFAAITPKVYMYLDIAHSGWMGWEDNINKVASIYNNNAPVQGGLGEGFNAVRGFITNTANYTPLMENFDYADYFLNQNLSAKFYSWNDTYSEQVYIAALMSIGQDGKLAVNNHMLQQPANPLYKNMHFLVDTSRNGWNKPLNLSLFDNYYANLAQVDIRHHRGNWCNVQNVVQNGQVYSPGVGFIPQANPLLQNPAYTSNLPIDAYVWVKPAGQSDGYYDKTTGKGDQMCSADNGGSHNDNRLTDSLQSPDGSPAPKAGAFFDSAFKRLLDNTVVHNTSR